MMRYHGDQPITRGSALKSRRLVDFDIMCDRCGKDLHAKGQRNAADGLRLCRDCRAVDPTYRKIRIGGTYIETTDDQLAELERQEAS
jgi:hypothetical protein